MGTIAGAEFARLLEDRGLDFLTGVPCSLIGSLIAELETHPRLPYVAAVREDVAVGLAGGAWLGGRRPAILMQNSGLGTSLNALASFSLMYGLPALLLVTWRGHGGRDAPEHILMGEISPGLLDLLHIPSRVLSADSVEADLAWAVAEMARRLAPVALLVPPGVVAHGESHPATAAAPPAPPAGGDASPGALAGGPRPSRREALAAVVAQLDGQPAVHANGYICRESFAIADRPENFYMIGSMGLASAIGLGLALTGADRTPVVLDGDGNLLMNLGILPMIGGLAPPNLVHCVFDNEVYGSTGNQASPACGVRLDRLARAAGYRTATAVTTAHDVGQAVRAALRTPGPHFILAKVTAESGEAPRIPYSPTALRDRFRAAMERP